jgi:hypothetical protein
MLYKFSMNRLTLLFIFASLLAGSCSRYVQRETTTNSTPVPGGGDLTTISISGADSDAAEPALAADDKGTSYVLFVQHNPDKSADLFLQRIGENMAQIPERIRINPSPGTVKAWRGDPPTIAIAENGAIYVGWNLKVESNGKSANDLVLSVSADGGQTFAAPVRVNDDTVPVSHGMHSLVLDKEGKIYMAWLDERNVRAEPEHEDVPAASAMMMFHHKENIEPNSEVFFSVSSDGGKTFASNKKLASEICPCCKTSVVAAPDGRLYVSWRQVLPNGTRHIAVASSGDKGATFSQGVVVSDDKWKIDACPVSGATLSAGAGGLLSVAWYTAGEAGDAGVYESESTDGGKTFSQRRLLSSEAVSGTPVLLGGPPGKPACIFAARENRVVTNIAGGQVSSSAIPDATLPAAIRSGQVLQIAFVRSAGERRSVFLTRLPT